MFRLPKGWICVNFTLKTAPLRDSNTGILILLNMSIINLALGGVIAAGDSDESTYARGLLH